MRILAFLLLAATTSALADDAGILRCRAIKDSAARLACYDGIAVPSAAAAQPKAAAPSSAGAASAPAAAATPAAPATPAQQFGLESKTPVAQLDYVESTVPGLFKGWGANTIITLANGQQWQISDGSTGYVNMENAKVKIKRGFMGSFYLDIEGNNRVPRVRRVK
jgi:predicted lipid-binding transport protein (Tim44 family)